MFDRTWAANTLPLFRGETWVKFDPDFTVFATE